MGTPERQLSSIEQRLLNDFQHDMPLEPRPFARLADSLGVTEQQVLSLLSRLQDEGVVSRVGPVFRPNRVGVSTLAALAVPPARLTEVAEQVNAFVEVNHNYEREHEFNLWFVVTAPDTRHLRGVLDEIARATDLEPLELPMLEDYFIDLGFPLQWA